ncbi:MAG: hypothetical protein Fur0046_30750 [Cyanobacteria bacterium J069]
MMTTLPAAAQSLFEERGTLAPMQAEYSFAGKAGDTVTVSMTSTEFDTFLVLNSPSGEELASNDDYARSLNSTIVITLPASGTYKVLARSFSGQGGNYLVTVRAATPYDLAYSRATELYRNGDLDAALPAFTEAIRIDSERPEAYLDRGDLYFSQGNVSATRSDYQAAIALYEKQGDRETAQMLREQLSYLETPPDGSESF